MKPKSQERGQALILIVFAAVAIFAFAALAIDGSRVFSDRRHAQNAADTAVLAAALAKIRAIPPAVPNDAAAAAGLARAATNGFDNNGTSNIVEVNSCATLGLDPPCVGLPADANPAEYIQVVIRLSTPTTFARVIGFDQVPSVVTAIARASGSADSGSSSTNAALFATQGGNLDQCFDVNGGANLNLVMHNSGFFVNCSGSQAVTLGGSATLDMVGPNGEVLDGQVVGCFITNGSFSTDPIVCAANGGVSRVYNASSFAGVPTLIQPTPTCSGPGSFDPATSTYSPGSLSSIVVTAPTFMRPGVYCISGGITLAGGSLSDVSTETGTVQIVLQDLGITMVGGSSMDFTDLEIYGNNASLTIAGGSAFRADRLRFFSTGTGIVDLGGGAELSSGNAYFYFHRGNIQWNGNSILNLHGPPQGDQFGGLLIHKPWDNHSEVIINGGASIDLTGTFMVPGSPVTINGDADFDLHSQIIGSTFRVAGSSQVDIFYDPNENYTPPNSPMIQLTK